MSGDYFPCLPETRFLSAAFASAQSLVSVTWQFCAFEMQTHTVLRPLLYYYYFCQSIWQRSSGKQQIHVCCWIDVVDRPGHCRLDEGSRNRCVDGWCQVMGKGGTVLGHLVDRWKMEWQRQTDSVSVQKPSSATVNWHGLFYDTSVLNSQMFSNFEKNLLTVC